MGSLTPDSTTERDKHTKGSGIVLHRIPAFHSLQDADHNRKNDELADGGNREWDIWDSISIQRLEVCVVLKSW